MFNKEFPIDKSDVQYNPTTGEVSLKREKFDELIKFTQDLMEHAENAEDQRAAAQYRARRADASRTVLEAILQELAEGSRAIKEWVDEHSIKKLSEKTKIPYATCHRIVTERLDASKVTIKDLVILLSKVTDRPSRRMQMSPALGVVFAGPEGHWQGAISNLRCSPLNVSEATSGKQAMDLAEKTRPDVIFVDPSTPGLSGEEVLNLGQGKAPVVMVKGGSEESLEEIAQKLSTIGGKLSTWRFDFITNK